jgi:NTE family protein
MGNEVTLVLGGIGVKGIANIGVFEALSNHDVKVKKIIAAGTSAMVAVQYALRKRPEELIGLLVNFFENNHRFLWGLEQMSGLFQTRKRRIVDSIDYFLRERLYCRANFSRMSVLSWDMADPLLFELFGNKTFADLEIPVALSTIDVNNKNLVLIESGKLIDAIKASIAYSGLFPPVHFDGRELESSTPYCELPLHAVGKEDTPVLAIDFPGAHLHPYPRTLLEIISRVSEIRNQAIKTRLLIDIDYVIKLENLRLYRWGNYRKIPGMVRRAKEDTLRQLVTLLDL